MSIPAYPCTFHTSIGHLQVQPELRLNLEYLSKGYRRLSRDPTLAANDLADTHPVQAALGCQFTLAKS
jgi:hypothetical protein